MDEKRRSYRRKVKVWLSRELEEVEKEERSVIENIEVVL